MTGHGVASEVGRLRTVLLHRPGDELRRLTPRNNDELLFDGVPWVDRAQEEHDAFAAALRDRGVEVLYLRDLLARDAGGRPRRAASCSTRRCAPQAIGPTLAPRARATTSPAWPPAALAEVLVAGLAHEELAGARRPRRRG